MDLNPETMVGLCCGGGIVIAIIAGSLLAGHGLHGEATTQKTAGNAMAIIVAILLMFAVAAAAAYAFRRGMI